MNRVLVVLGLVTALVLILVGALIVFVAEPPPPGPPVPRPKPPPTGPEDPPEPVDRVPLATEHADPDAAEPVPPDPGYTARVLGRVVSRTDGSAVENARLTLLHPTGTEIATAVTDDTGRYLFEGVPDLTPLVLRVEHARFLSGYCCALEASRERAQTKDVRLAPATEIEVALRLVPFDQPPGAAVVRLLRNGEEVASVPTDVHGKALLRCHWIGLHEISVDGPEIAALPREPLTVHAGPRITLAREVREGGSLRVRVRTARDEPAPSVAVHLEHPLLPTARGTADETGTVVFERLHHDDRWTVRATRPDGHSISARATVVDRETHDVDLAFAPTGKILGTVETSAGHPLPGAAISVAPDDPSAGSPLRLTTDAGGRFRAAHVRPGTWHVSLTGPAPRASVEVVVTADETANAALQVPDQGGGRIAGIVLDGDGEPLAGLELRLDPGDRRATTGTDGRFVVDDVPPDRAHALRTVTSGWHLEDVQGRSPVVVRASGVRTIAVHVKAQFEGGPSEPVDAASVALPRTGTWDGLSRRVDVRGTVRGRLRTPLGAVRVACRGIVTFTEADGTFLLDGVPARKDDDEPVLALEPPAGMYLPRSWPIAIDAGRAGATTDVLLLQRPYVIYVSPSSGHPADPTRPLRCFSGVPDRFLGSSRPAFGVVEAASYDRAWIHLPPAHVGKERVPVGVAFESDHGATVAVVDWEPERERRGFAGAYKPRGRTSRVTVDARIVDAARARLTLRQLRVALPELRDVTYPPGLDARLASPRVHTVDLSGRRKRSDRLRLDLRDLAAGTYRLTWTPESGAVRSVEFRVPDERWIELP